MHRTHLLSTLILLVVMTQGMAVSADDKANSLMQQVAAATRRTRSLSAVLTVRQQVSGGKMEVKAGRVFLRKPNFAHVELPLEFGGSYATVNSDGKRTWERTVGGLQRDGNHADVYRSVPTDARGRNIQFYFALPVAFFFDPAAPLTTMFAADKAGDLHCAGQKTIGGVTYDIVEQAVLQPAPYTVRLYISPDKQLSRVETDMPQSTDMPHRQYYEADLSRVSLNRPIPPQTFAFTPTGQIASDASPDARSRLPVVGAPAPGFMLRTLGGRVLTLPEMLRGKKAVYLDFWFCECMVCRHEFPALQELYASLERRGFAVYAVNAFDNAAKVSRFKSQMDLLKSATFPVVLTGPGDPAGVLKKYGVDSYPSGVLVSADGTVLYTSIGYDDKPGLRDLRAALTRAGLRP